MTITATGRRHIVRALKDALHIRDAHARDILASVRNEWLFGVLDGDMRSARFLVSPSTSHVLRNTATLYLDRGRGYDATPLSLMLTEDDMARWNALPLEEAYAIAAEVHNGRSQAMIDEDDRLAAEAAAIVAFDPADQSDLDDDLDLDAIFGPVPEDREFAWIDGTVRAVRMADAGDHVIATVEIGFGGSEPVEMTMLPLFSGAAEDLIAYATSQIDVSARLSVGRLNAFDRAHPAGVDKSLPLLDMIVSRRDVPALTGTFRRAA